MAEKIKLVRGDTRPQLQLTLTNELDDLNVDLTDATLVMRFRQAGSDQVLDTLNGIVTDGVGGKVVFLWNLNTLNVEPGDYEGEIEITFPSLEVQTVYELLKFRVRQDF
jgi:hypothetical protein